MHRTGAYIPAKSATLAETASPIICILTAASSAPCVPIEVRVCEQGSHPDWNVEIHVLQSCLCVVALRQLRPPHPGRSTKVGGNLVQSTPAVGLILRPPLVMPAWIVGALRVAWYDFVPCRVGAPLPVVDWYRHAGACQE